MGEREGGRKREGGRIKSGHLFCPKGVLIREAPLYVIFKHGIFEACVNVHPHFKRSYDVMMTRLK